MKDEQPLFRRKAYDKLLKWKESSNGRTAILVEGARRVGKTTVVKAFAKKEYKSFIIIDFSQTQKEILDLFMNEFTTDLDMFFGRLQTFTNTKLHERESVIVFDEVQLFPLARQAIKHLVADGRYDYIETGSLISLRKNVENILIPSEEDSFTMYPMDFEEFCWANGDEVTIPFIKEHYERREPLGQAMHRVVLRRYREYMIVGGMPQVVFEYVRSKDYIEVNNVKNSILKLLDADVEKIPSPNSTKVTSIIRATPLILGKKKKKFSPGAIKKGSGMSDFRRSIDWLEQADILNVCRDVTDPSAIMCLTVDESKMKCYFFDTGLLVAQSIRSNLGKTNDIYKSLLLDKLSINEGMYFENMVAQELTASDCDLYFHIFKMKGLANSYEIDFILSDGRYVIPIEVKSSISSKHASLNHFMKKYKKKFNECFVVHDKDLELKCGITYIPIYMTMFVARQKNE